ncbi:UvrD-like helicase C-terminal domain-containing protein [Roseateles sp. YR242]|uniref:UvrD-helicase domain-containing protein n=1 Tax=Roseateles sp. YR242 TaxID=1855305 RepID=UPI0008BB021A|nr:UvrD-helicase domain-containing protein [Roseateles sp. YR242]SEL89934.1 UvrD-like helicase C-terminal domain-containing protein [Roseateles sp. YR242]
MTAAYTLNGAPVARERFYALACDPARSVVVEACAGAGKTWMLVSRILRALLDGTQPQDIVAITFTRKAAGEMRERLNEWLHEFAHCDHDGRVSALRQRGMSDTDAAALAPALASLQQRLLQGSRAVEIRTFHAWFSQLLRAAPLELLQSQGLSPELQLLEDESDLMPELWHRFHTAVLADAALLADYESLCLTQGRNKLTGWLTAAFSKRVEIRLAHQEGRLLSSMPDAGDVVPEFAAFTHPLEGFGLLRAPLQALAVELGGMKGATTRKCATALEQALQLEDEAALEGVRAALFTADGSPRKAVGDAPEILSLLDRVTRLQMALDQRQARQWHLQMCGLALVLLDQFEHLKRERGLVDMNDLERGALALLGDPALAGWVQERLDAQVRHLLIDEFQDTSPLQWHALYAWLSGYVGAGGGASGQRPPSVFIVGDPKQSIYRFRRAEPRVFAAARDFVREGLDGVLLACDHTRRNSPQVLAAVNAVFESATLAQQYSGFRAHTTESGEGDPLDGVFHLVDEGPEDAQSGEARGEGVWRPSLTQPRREAELHRREAEAQRIAGAIEALLAGDQVEPGDIFVLARKREGLRVLAQVLKSRGIAHAAPEDMPLLDAPDVRDLLALLDLLASNGHNLSMAHALRSPLFGVDDADLLDLAARAKAVKWLPGLDEDDGLADEALADEALADEPPPGWDDAVPFEVDAAAIVDDTGAIPSVGERPWPGEPSSPDGPSRLEGSAALDDLPSSGAMSSIDERPCADGVPPVDESPSPDEPRSWWAALMDADPSTLSPALQRARELLPRWSGYAVLRSPHDLLDAIVHEGDLMARLAAAVPPSERRARLHAVEALLSLALDLDGGRYAGLYGFVRSLKQRALKLAAPAEPDAVQLLTVHGAKGLEAKVVILMDTEAGPARAESMALAVSWPVQEAVPSTVAFLVSESRPPASLQPLLDDEKEQRQREELNALYVAMTRARHRLLISRTAARRASSSATWWARLQPLAAPMRVPDDGGADAEVDVNASIARDLDQVRAGDRVAVLKQLPPAPPMAQRPAVAGAVQPAEGARGGGELGQGPEVVDDSAALGEALHRVLEWHSGPQGRQHPLERLMAAAAQMYGLDARRDERLQRSVKAILGSESCAPFFDPDRLRWHGNEVPLSWRQLDMRLDRLVCRRGEGGAADTWWVLDYKLHPAPQNNDDYLEQLWRYREAVRALQPGEPVRCAFITGQGRLIDCTERVADRIDWMA